MKIIEIKKSARKALRIDAMIFNLIFYAIFLIGAVSSASAAGVDYRVIFIDNALYSAIPDTGDRNKAIDLLLADIGMFEEPEHVAAVETVVFLRAGMRGQELRREPQIPAGTSTVDALGKIPELAAMRAGSVPYEPGLDAIELRDGLRRYFTNLGEGATVDIHVFASGWKANLTDQTAQMMTLRLVSECVLQDDGNREIVKGGIELRFEFRAPEQQPIPSSAAQAALITLVSGTADQTPNVLSRGAAGPRCPLTDPWVAMPEDPDPNGTPECRRPESSVTAGSFQPCGGLLMAPVGPVLREPLSLVAAESPPHASLLNFDAIARPTGQRVELQTAGLVLPVGTQTDLTGRIPQGSYEAWIGMMPDAGCQPAQPISYTVATGHGGLQIAVGAASCVDMRIPLPDLVVQ